jgi:hypothetical protein
MDDVQRDTVTKTMGKMEHVSQGSWHTRFGSVNAGAACTPRTVLYGKSLLYGSSSSVTGTVQYSAEVCYVNHAALRRPEVKTQYCSYSTVSGILLLSSKL